MSRRTREERDADYERLTIGNITVEGQLEIQNLRADLEDAEREIAELKDVLRQKGIFSYHDEP